MARLSDLMSEACKKKHKKKGMKKKSKILKEEAIHTAESLETLVEMIQEGTLADEEIHEIKEDIETIFSNLLEEAENMPEPDVVKCDNEGEYEDDPEHPCTWTGLNSELKDDGTCPKCGSSVTETDESALSEASYNVNIGLDKNSDKFGEISKNIKQLLKGVGYETNDSDSETYDINTNFDTSEEADDFVKKAEKAGADFVEVEAFRESLEDEDLSEARSKKTSSKKKRANEKYRNSAAGKKSLKLAAIKRRKYAKKIKRCSGTGKTFSFKKMACVTPKKRI